MRNLTSEDFTCIKILNTKKENERQWEKSKAVFDHFYTFLLQKGLGDPIARRRTKDMVFFVMDYLFVHDDAESILDVTDYTIRQFLGDWYIRHFPKPTIHGITLKLRAFADFFNFLNTLGYITDEELTEIKAVCKDRKWFEMRLKTYKQARNELLTDSGYGLSKKI